jgi:hypothetical protein
VEGIRNRNVRRIRRSIRIMKSKKIRIQPLCDEYSSWVPYLSLRRKIVDQSFV